MASSTEFEPAIFVKTIRLITKKNTVRAMSNAINEINNGFLYFWFIDTPNVYKRVYSIILLR